MGTFQTTIDIARPARDVFAVLADTETTPLWYEAVVSAVKTTPGPVGNGTRYRLRRSLSGGPIDNDVEISEYEPPAAVTLASLTGPTPFRYRYRLTPTAANTTRVTLTGDITGDGLPGVPPALAPLAAKFFGRGMHQNLASLKRLIESRP
jgi:uncharacterized protein YndB with AHSA1/START domain